MSNRDWHSAPLQGGGRDAYDYGLTEFAQDEPTDWRAVIRYVIGALVFGAIVGLVLMQAGVAA